MIAKIKSYPKVNIFLNITGYKNNLHTISSRFKLAKNIYDTITIKKKNIISDEFLLNGSFKCSTKDNTIYKAFIEFAKVDSRVASFKNNYYIEVDKKIPSLAGLGGGSSNAGVFIKFINEFYSLNHPLSKLIEIGKKVGSDTPFFITGYDSANVEGAGEDIVEFKDMEYSVDIITPNIECSTKDVYQKFKKLSKYNIKNELKDMSITELIKYKREYLNDLYIPAVSLYRELSHFDGYFSGSGSSFFTVKL